jgi:type I restriction enzyme M protein
LPPHSDECTGCFSIEDESGETIQPLPNFAAALDALTDTLQPFLNTLTDDVTHAEVQKELADALPAFHADIEAFQQAISEQEAAWKEQKTTNGDLKQAVD